ncbi:MAG: hypothetical protein EBR82_58745 [Caulobacteraceae bacterium]|nr:hypothetical protein [Caulobacteraceae bacterium]
MSTLVGSKEGQSLVELDEAKRHIALARDMAMAEELHEWRDRAAAMAHYARMRGDSHEAANQAAEIKVRAEAALGALDSEARPTSVGRRGHGMGSVAEPIPELGVGKETRANWRKLGALEDDQLDKVIEQVKAADDTISTAAVVKVAEKDTKITKLREAAFQRAAAQAEADSKLTQADRVAAASVMSRIAKYQPTSEFITTHSLLAAQAAEGITCLPEIPADSKGVAALRLAASQYQQVAQAINTFTGGTHE